MKAITLQIVLVVTLAVTAGATEKLLEKQVDEFNKNVSQVSLDNVPVDRKVPHDLQQKVDNLVSFYNSPEYQMKLKQEQGKIRKILALEGQTGTEVDDDISKKAFGDPVYVFVSQSVPLQTLRHYAAGMAAQKSKGIIPEMVFRGFIGGAKKIAPTARLIGKIIRVDSDCDMSTDQCDTWPVSVTVDPLKFRKFGIRKVPAIVLDRGAKKEPLIVYGDVSVEYAIQKFNDVMKLKKIRLN
jgi:type-F conjugative transfer system pilin assembly protein TrbC